MTAGPSATAVEAEAGTSGEDSEDDNEKRRI